MMKKSDVIRSFVTFVAVGIAANIVTSIFITKSWPKLNVVAPRWLGTVVGAVIVAVVGLGLFLFRKYHQKIYGLAELGFALAVGWSSLRRAQTTSDLASWIAVLAAAYLIARGLLNYDEGRNKELAASATR
jgi:hypothetical protein